MTVSQVFEFTDKNYKNSSGTNMVGLQGGCSDGTYVYALKTDEQADSVRETRVVKIDPKTWKQVAVSEPIKVGHANDLTYNPKTGLLYAVHMGGPYTTIDPSTLTVVETLNLNKGFFGIAYDAINDRYVLAKAAQAQYNFTLMTYNGNLSFASEFPTVRLGYTAQGIFCDSKYIYYSQSGDSTRGTAGRSIVTVHDWDGNRVCILYIETSLEIEAFFFHDGAYYACFNAKDGDYIAQLSVKK
jgi:hypothetical protein